MSRIDEALKRAAATPKLAAVDGRIADGADRPAVTPLELYPTEDGPFAATTADDRSTAHVAFSAGHRPDVIVAPKFSKAYRGRLVIDPTVPPASVEQYRRLAATMHHLQDEQGLGRLMVSSALPKEGKTLTVTNLALTLSESYGRRVLLIDADLRRPSIHEVFGISSRYGLSDALRPERPRFQFSRVSQNLWVMPAGSQDADPMSALASHHLERFLDDVTSRFDWVLLDAPPMGAMADAALLARLTRAVIVVIAAGSTPYAMIERIIRDLGREHIVGTVLNRVEQIATHWSDYYLGSIPMAEDWATESPAELRLTQIDRKSRTNPPLKSSNTATSPRRRTEVDS